VFLLDIIIILPVQFRVPLTIPSTNHPAQLSSDARALVICLFHLL